MISFSLSYFNQSGLVRILHLRVPAKIKKKSLAKTVHSNLFYGTAITVQGIQTDTADTSALFFSEKCKRKQKVDF